MAKSPWRVFWMFLVFFIVIGAIAAIVLFVRDIRSGIDGNETIINATGCTATTGCASGLLCNTSATPPFCYDPTPTQTNVWQILFFIILILGGVGGMFLWLYKSKRIKGELSLDKIDKIVKPWLKDVRREFFNGEISLIGAKPYYVGENHNFPRYYLLYWRHRKSASRMFPDGRTPPKHELLAVDVDRTGPLTDPQIYNAPMYIDEFEKYLAALKYGRIGGMVAPIKIEGPWTEDAQVAFKKLQEERLKQAMEGG